MLYNNTNRNVTVHTSDCTGCTTIWSDIHLNFDCIGYTTTQTVIVTVHILESVIMTVRLPAALND